jgi:hypothetical protein
MPKLESEPLLFRAERISAKTGESGPVPRSPVPSGRKDAAFRAIFPPSPDCMLNLQTVWRRIQSSANRYPVYIHTVVYKFLHRIQWSRIALIKTTFL